MIVLENVVKEYPNGVGAINGISLHIERGEFVFVVGDSGSGKSTLIKLLLRELLPTSGKIMVNDILNSTKADLNIYQQAISETENMQLRNAFQQIRNDFESSQYELFKVAQTKGYYNAAETATTQEIAQVKSEIEQ